MSNSATVSLAPSPGHRGTERDITQLRMRHLALDQLIYSASNFVLAIVGGRSLLQADFGRFAFVILAISVVVNMGKAAWHEPDLGTGNSILGPSSASLIAAALLALVAGWFGATMGVGSLGVVAVAATIGAVVQDRARYRALAIRRVNSVVIGDAAWLAVIGAALINHDRFDRAHEILLIWLVGAVVGSLPPAMAVAASRPTQVASVEVAPAVSSSQRKTLLVDFMLFSGMTQLGGLAVAVFLSLEAFASLRGAIIIFGPIGILTGALTTWIFGSLRKDSPDVRAVATKAGGLGLISLVLTAMIVVVPQSLGQSLLGSAWPARWVLFGIGLAVSLQAISTPGMMILRLLDLRGPLLMLRLGAFATFVVAVLGTAYVTRSAAGTAMAYTVVNGALALGVWTRLLTSFALSPIGRVGTREPREEGNREP